MNREFLKGLGLEDDAIDKVMTEHGKSLNSVKEKADKVDGLESQIEDYKSQISDRDNQLEELKKINPKELQAEIDRLKETNETSAKDFQAKLEKQAFEFGLERALVNANVHNPKAVKALLDIEQIKLDGDKFLGLDTQLESLKESDPNQFKQDQKPNSPTIVAPGNPNGGGSGTLTKEQIMKEPDAIKRQKLIQENSQLFQ